jgi:hypothetical protein
MLLVSMKKGHFARKRIFRKHSPRGCGFCNRVDIVVKKQRPGVCCDCFWRFLAWLSGRRGRKPLTGCKNSSVKSMM